MGSKKRIDERLLEARIAIENALGDEAALAALGSFDFGETTLQAGKALYEQARALTHRQQLCYGSQYRATDAARAARREAHASYRGTLEIARLAHRGDRKGRKSLLLGGCRRKGFSAWLERVETFYDNLVRDRGLLKRMTRFGYDEARLAHEWALVQAAAAANAAQEQRKSEAQAATRQRDAALRDLDAWLSEFKVVLRVALARAA